MTPESFKFTFGGDDKGFWVDLVVDSEFPEQLVSLAADFDNVPDFGINEHKILLSPASDILIEIKIIIFPIWADFLIAYSITACFPLDVESVQAQQRSELAQFHFLEDVVDFCVLFTFLMLEDVAQVILLASVDLYRTQVGIYHVGIKIEFVLVCYL